MLIDMDDALDAVLARYCSALLDGERVDGCVAASEEEGWVFCHDRPHGQQIPILKRRQGKVVPRSYRFGQVRIEAPYFVRGIAEHRYGNRQKVGEW